jgi:lysyl-tRNA synthetase class 2
VFRLERNRRGPRVYILGRRVHEYHLGLLVVAAVLSGRLLHPWGLWPYPAAALALGAWLVVKDWRDLVPSQRDTCAWRLGVHRRAAPLRAVRHADGLPTLAAFVAFSLGLVNLLSALTPSIAWRHHLLLQLEPVEAVPIFHTLAVPASVALLLIAGHLRLRRRRAWQAAVLVLLLLGVLSLLKGLDFEEALLSWFGAGLLWWGRDAFYVRPCPLRIRSSLLLLGSAGAAFATGAGAVWRAGFGDAGPVAFARETVDLFAFTRGAVVYGDELAWLPLTGGLIGLLGILALALLLFRPIGVARVAPGEDERRAVVDLVRAHGADTLAFFKLRRDIHYFFSSDRRAFVAYRVQGSVLLVAGDPVGPAEVLPELLRELGAFAEVRGLRLGVLGAAEALLPLYRGLGLRPFYIGDEAIIDAAAFSLEGRAIRKVRQAVSRLEQAGYTVELHDFEWLGPPLLAELERVSAAWLGGAPERGFSMAMDSLRNEQQAGSTVVVARDSGGEVRGFLHFVPTYGRAAVSLSFMRRDRSSPNGLTEFLIVRAIELLRERGIAELSLNFAAFARLLDRPSTRLERLLGRLVTLGNPFFQIESLYRFNVKFAPRWEPRYLLYEGALGLPRVGLAAMRVEGQLPRLRS